MLELLIIVISILAVLTGIYLAIQVLFFSKKGGANGKKRTSRKERSAIMKRSNRRLSQNPKDPKALVALSDLYFEDGDYEKAVVTLSMLEELAQYNKNLDRFDITKKYAIALLKLGQLQNAHKILIKALAIDPTSFEVNFNLGLLQYKMKQFDSAATFLKAARHKNPAHKGTVRYLGLCYFKLGRFKDALLELKQTYEESPDDKEILFSIGQCYNALGNKDQAVKILTPLRSDIMVGPSACLATGDIYAAVGRFPEAITNYELGLNHKTIAVDVQLDLKYKLANAYMQVQNYSSGTALLKEIQEVNPRYKDIELLIKKYADFIQNKNLSIYLLGAQQEFADVCRKICFVYYEDARISIRDMAITQNQYLDIVCEVDTKKWSDNVIFRFIRSGGKVSDLILRELYAKMKEESAGRALCMTVGVFSEEAKSFVDARLIDLIEKPVLEKLLKKVELEVN